jgi:hypothetical protein
LRKPVRAVLSVRIPLGLFHQRTNFLKQDGNIAAYNAPDNLRRNAGISVNQAIPEIDDPADVGNAG